MTTQVKIPHSRPLLGSAEARAAVEVVQSGFVGTGDKVRSFEHAVAEFTQRRFALATTSGSAALHLALLALDVNEHSEVILPAFVCRAVLNCVLATRARPVLVDIDPLDLTASFSSTCRALTHDTKALILPHMFGAPADVERFAQLGVPIIEDAASSLGASYHDKPLGSFGVISIFSFAATKMITTGHGGMILTNDPECAALIEQLVDYDSNRLNGSRIAFNYRLTDVEAAIGLVQLARLPDFVRRRREIAHQYTDTLSDLLGICFPTARDGGDHCFYRYVLRVESPSQPLIETMSAHGIDARTSVAHFLYDYLGLPETAFTNCAAIRRHLISLPIYPELDESQVQMIAQVMRQAYREVV